MRIMENKMETTIQGLVFRVYRSLSPPLIKAIVYTSTLLKGTEGLGIRD